MTPLELLAENEEWLALNKPAGLLSFYSTSAGQRHQRYPAFCA